MWYSLINTGLLVIEYKIWLQEFMHNSIILMGHMRAADRYESVNVEFANERKVYLSMSLAKTICEKTFSTSRTSNNLSLSLAFASGATDFPCRVDSLRLGLGSERRCEGCRLLSLTAHSTRPGGYRSAPCMLASSVFRTAINYTNKMVNKV